VGRTKLYQYFLESKGVSTDTRTIKKGQIFFALTGNNFNGNKYVEKALKKGAAYAIIDDEAYNTSDKCIVVKNSLATLQELAKQHAKKLKIPIIAITGSNGKTTTKELINAVLSTTYKTFATKGNLNNHIGVPLSILSITPEHQIAIIEMGANHLNEIDELCHVAQPKFGLITNIGKAHLDGFGSEKGIQQGKGELFEYLDANEGELFVNMNDFKVAEVAYFMKRVMTYGTGNFYDINGKLQKANPYLNVLWTPKKDDAIQINTQLIGSYNIDNVLAAITVGTKFDVTNENIKKGIEKYTPTNNRSQMVQQGSNTIILDAYNANPSSMKAALSNLQEMDSKKKVVILGDMLELGKYSSKEHENIVKSIKKMDLKQVVLVGEEFAPFSNGHKHFANSADAAKWFQKQKFSNTTILIKGSRGIALEKLLDS